MASVSRLDAADQSQLLQHWWQWVLLIFITVPFIIGTTYIIISVIRKCVAKRTRSTSTSLVLHKSTKADLTVSIAQALPYVTRTTEVLRPNSFGVYLGTFNSPPTSDQTQLLRQWDLIVLDPFQNGVIDAVMGTDFPATSQRLARIDIKAMQLAQLSLDDIAIQTLEAVIRILRIRRATCLDPCFTGILLACHGGGSARLVLRDIAESISKLGLLVYLETSAPNFLDSKILNSDAITGLLIRNATILPNGEKRDVFQMAEMRPLIKAFMSQSCLRTFVVLVWDVVRDEVQPSKATLKRAFQLCRFYNALAWIGQESAIKSAHSDGPLLEPLGAFDFLKESRVMSFHNTWSSNSKIQNISEPNPSFWIELERIFPSVGILRNSGDHRILEVNPATVQIARLPACDYYYEQQTGDPLSVSTCGTTFTYLGCFPLGLSVLEEAFVQVTFSLQKLREKSLLDPLTCSTMLEIGEMIQQFCLSLACHSSSEPRWLCAAQGLARDLITSASGTGSASNQINIYVGLDSSFHSPLGMFWGVYSVKADSSLDIFVSKNIQDLNGVVLHTYLSKRGFSRHECFEAELALEDWASSLIKDCALPQRFHDDIAMLSPQEIILFLQRIDPSRVSRKSKLIDLIRLACERELLDGSDFSQRRRISTIGYLSGQVSVEELIASRIEWYRRSGSASVTLSQASAMFREVHSTLDRIMSGRREEELRIVIQGLEGILRENQIDALSDLLAISVFCYVQKEAFEEAYMEVCDRNPLFNDQPDQAAVFAELFAVGSRCEAYFDLTPNAFGKLLSDKYRTHYGGPGNEPPILKDGESQVESAYAAAQIDIDPEAKKKEMNGLQEITFLSVFAIPALIDILLLTTIGRGLYLSGSMMEDQQSATLAIVISLFLGGAIGSWTTIGGSYYLVSMAFPVMNMFVAVRLIGGFALTLVAASIGFVAFGIRNDVRAGLVFFLYLIAITTYLTLLATLANFQYPGSTFQSGRQAIITLVPLLFISPITTIWVTGYDVVIYLSVMYVFVFLLLRAVRRLAGKWSSWFLEIYCVEDADVREWYIKNKLCHDDGALTYPKMLKISREALLLEVLRQQGWKVSNKKTADPLVLKLAKFYNANIFLMEWYCGLSGIKIPVPYSTTWNLQTKVALKTIRELQTGTRLHNSLMHWLKAGDEVGCSLLYFIVALLDKWIVLICGEQLLGLLSVMYRMPIGFSLAYYLAGAVLLDINAQKLHKIAGQHQDLPIDSTKELPAATERVISFRRKIYWKMLGRYMLFHVWSLAVTSCLLWIFESSGNRVILFICYVGAYTGLLWFQFTKIFSGPRSLKPLILAASIGLPLGLILRRFCPYFTYNDVTALAVATWTAALSSLFSAGLYKRVVGGIQTKLLGTYHVHNVRPNQAWSQQEISNTYNKICGLHSEERFRVDPRTSTGLAIRSYFARALQDFKSHQLYNSALKAFPSACDIIEKAALVFESGDVILEYVQSSSIDIEQSIMSVSRELGGRLHVIILLENADVFRSQSDSRSFCKLAAESLLHSIAETLLGFSHTDASLLEWVLVNSVEKARGPNVPQSIQNQLVLLGRTPSLAKNLIQHYQKQHLQYLSLEIQCDSQWDRLPRDIRELLLKRCIGEACELSADQRDFLYKEFSLSSIAELEDFVAKCNYGALVALCCQELVRQIDITSTTDSHRHISLVSDGLLLLAPSSDLRCWRRLVRSAGIPVSALYHTLGTWFKFLTAALVADLDLQRELEYVLQKHCPTALKGISTCSLTAVWVYSKFLQDLLLPLFLFYGRKAVLKTWKQVEGTKVSIEPRFVSIESSEGPLTGFVFYGENGAFKLKLYAGRHRSQPSDRKSLRYINTYSRDMRLQRRAEYLAGDLVKEFSYEFAAQSVARPKRLSRFYNARYPMARRCTRGGTELQTVYFDARGLVEFGSYVKDGYLVRFRCHYRSGSNLDDELLRAEFVLPHMSCTVSWAVPSVYSPEKFDTWAPHSQVTEATFVIGSSVYESKWRYDHKFNPVITTTLNGEAVENIDLILHDHLGVLKKPNSFRFIDDDPLIFFKSAHPSFLSRWGLKVKHHPISTSLARSRLWKAWKSTPGFDGVTARWLDERLLRRDRSLKAYWRKRDWGNLTSAASILLADADNIMASIDIDKAISGFTPLAMKMGDLFGFSQGGDANIRTRFETNPDFDDDNLRVLAADTGTWPNEGGGVSACRRDIINNLPAVKWHMIAESANDFGIPKHQTEKNVQSLKVIPLWGLDFLTPTHGIFRNKLFSEIEHVPRHKTKLDVEAKFIPILTALVKAARTVQFSNEDVLQTTRALVNLNSYFQGSKHWSATWTMDSVKMAWRNLWVSSDLVSPCHSATRFRAEVPTIPQLDLALELWYRYLFIFSIPLPEKIPPVFQASHHSVSAAYGVVCKIRRGCTLQIWDHAISWRETNLYLSSAQCNIHPFARNALLGLMKMTSIIILHHADTILPCADVFNPGWETEIGTCQGEIESRRVFRRKIDPITNGITDCSRFKQITEIKSTLPTVTMLSHIWYAKDIKTAILSADIVVNDWGFREYRLEIYGALDKAPAYSADCQEMIASKSLQDHVKLCGEADPIEVLEKTWLFLNSSISEGLPLALGEAALTGAPVVCTDVGASWRILTDPDDGSCFSAIVAPNDPRALARAEIELLAMIGKWSAYANGASDLPIPQLSDKPSPDEVAQITKRMFDQSESRRALGMRTRAIIQKSFGGDRYLREHEQMLWVGKARKNMRDGIPAIEASETTARPISDAITAVASHMSAALSGHRSWNSVSFRDSALGGTVVGSVRSSIVPSSDTPATASSKSDKDILTAPPPIFVSAMAPHKPLQKLQSVKVHIVKVGAQNKAPLGALKHEGSFLPRELHSLEDVC